MNKPSSGSFLIPIFKKIYIFVLIFTSVSVQARRKLKKLVTGYRRPPLLIIYTIVKKNKLAIIKITTFCCQIPRLDEWFIHFLSKNTLPKNQFGY